MRITTHYCDMCGEVTDFHHLYKLNSFYADGRGHVLAGDASIFKELCSECIKELKLHINKNCKVPQTTR